MQADGERVGIICGIGRRQEEGGSSQPCLVVTRTPSLRQVLDVDLILQRNWPLLPSGSSFFSPGLGWLGCPWSRFFWGDSQSHRTWHWLCLQWTARCHNKLCLVIQVTSRSVPTWAFLFSLGPCGVLFKGPGGALGEGGRSCDPALSKSSEGQAQRAPSLRPQGSWGEGGTAESRNDRKECCFPSRNCH